MSLTVENYSEKSIVVRGDTKSYKDKLKELGGKWNSNLTGGAGWIYSKKSEEKVKEFLNSENFNIGELASLLPKVPSKPIVEILESIRAKAENMNTQERLTFLSKITTLISGLKPEKNNLFHNGIAPTEKELSSAEIVMIRAQQDLNWIMNEFAKGNKEIEKSTIAEYKKKYIKAVELFGNFLKHADVAENSLKRKKNSSSSVEDDELSEE